MAISSTAVSWCILGFELPLPLLVELLLSALVVVGGDENEDELASNGGAAAFIWQHKLTATRASIIEEDRIIMASYLYYSDWYLSMHVMCRSCCFAFPAPCRLLDLAFLILEEHADVTSSSS